MRAERGRGQGREIALETLLGDRAAVAQKTEADTAVGDDGSAALGIARLAGQGPVSYTHLDVYKRQAQARGRARRHRPHDHGLHHPSQGVDRRQDHRRRRPVPGDLGSLSKPGS